MWIAELLGVSPTNEDGTRRSIGYASRPLDAVLWYVTLQINDREYNNSDTIYHVQCEYECMEISRNVCGDSIYIAYIIHPVPLDELKNFVVFPCPRLDITRNGEPITFTSCNSGQTLIAPGLWVDVISWSPNKIE